VTTDDTWADRFQKSAFYASLDALSNDRAQLLGGYGITTDHYYNGTDAKSTFNSKGWFLGLNSKLQEHLSATARYDEYRPTTKTAHNLQSAVTVALVFPFENTKFMLDYQMKQAQAAGSRDTHTNTLQAEWMVHF